ncbi:MAG: Rpn family recombination-promoting nuclease/putative transposase [Lachnospiraceae bacterium]|nr:Rpn family recombination-promoting nuclease/putative transposase [Lachnospiraceae bacterium]
MDNTTFDYSGLTGPLKYRLTNDYMFKAFLQKNEKALRGLLCALLRLKPEEIKSVVITNPIVLGETITDKSIVMDIRLVMNNDRNINIEMQVDNLGDWPERSLTYLCKSYDQLKKGDSYIDSMKVIHIGILDFTPEGFPEELYLDYHFVNKKSGHIYSDKLTILMLQLNQLGNAEDEAKMPDLYHWARLFRATTWEEIVMLAEKNENIKECIVTLKELSEDEKIQLECEARERSRLDFAAATRHGYKKGHEDGREEGRQEGREEERISNIIKSIASLHATPLTEDQIAEHLVNTFDLTIEQAKQCMQDAESK